MWDDITRRRYDGTIRVEALSSMRRDAEAAPKCLEKITCDEAEKRLFENALRWAEEEMNECEQGELCDHLIPRRCPCTDRCIQHQPVKVPCTVPCNVPATFCATLPDN